uniref:Uncharacterized protein n=1 Tax=Rhizophora mucronata TaxID=61149 RepID=A0A2P2R0B5_RHIMU
MSNVLPSSLLLNFTKMPLRSKQPVLNYDYCMHDSFTSYHKCLLFICKSINCLFNRTNNRSTSNSAKTTSIQLH